MKANIMFKLGRLVALTSAMLVGNISAQAMLPTPEPEMQNPSSRANAAAINQGQVNGSTLVDTKTVAAVVSVNAQGQTTLKPIDANTRLQAGSIIEYQTSITNKSPDRMRSLNVTMSVPNEVKLVGDLSPSNPYASIDGRNFNRTPLRGRISGTLQDVPLDLYNHLRWTIEGLGVNETTVIKYRAALR